ncbi:MAG TPA: flagellar biosynthetic protein FliO [Acidimicrobiales bacterium]|nr:flagellar biosynthetic protein FliO [Acidimicrobiales bacterium]
MRALDTGGPVSAVHHAAAHAAGAAGVAPDISVGHVMTQMVFALVVVVGGIWGFAKIMGRTRRPRPAAAGSATGQLTVLSRQSLGKGLAIAAVQWGPREVLVGISGQTITFLNDARSDEAEAAADAADQDAPPDEVSGLAAALRNAPTSRRSLIEQLREATVRV